MISRGEKVDGRAPYAIASCCCCRRICTKDLRTRIAFVTIVSVLLRSGYALAVKWYQSGPCLLCMNDMSAVRHCCVDSGTTRAM